MKEIKITGKQPNSKMCFVCGLENKSVLFFFVCRIFSTPLKNIL